MEHKSKKDILQHGKQIISKEKNALSNLEKSLDVSFVEVVQFLLNIKGRLVISGIGKSALVAKKIVATMNSTGTAAIFMHAADAAHGDLGILQKEDVLLCISKSGETEELTFVQSMVKQYGNTTIAMTSNKKSTLGSLADYILFTPIGEEADQNNLAPTSSSTVQMAMGDALALSLSMKKGFTEKHFAKFHPGGTLGKKLYLTVENIMHIDLVPSVKKSDDLKKVIFEMTSKRLGATVVLSEQNSLLGIITDGDLRRMLKKHDNLESLKAIDIMSSSPKSVQKSIMAVDALKIMREHSIGQLVVLDKNKFIGLVHIHDILAKGI